MLKSSLSNEHVERREFLTLRQTYKSSVIMENSKPLDVLARFLLVIRIVSFKFYIKKVFLDSYSKPLDFIILYYTSKHIIGL